MEIKTTMQIATPYVLGDDIPPVEYAKKEWVSVKSISERLDNSRFSDNSGWKVISDIITELNKGR